MSALLRFNDRRNKYFISLIYTLTEKSVFSLIAMGLAFHAVIKTKIDLIVKVCRSTSQLNEYFISFKTDTKATEKILTNRSQSECPQKFNGSICHSILALTSNPFVETHTLHILYTHTRISHTHIMEFGREGTLNSSKPIFEYGNISACYKCMYTRNGTGQ